MQINESLFWGKVIKSASCWEWNGYRNKLGYGVTALHGTRKTALAHRVSFWLANRVDPGSMLVCHRCDNPSCVNPSHLFLGTNFDNVADCVAKGRLSTNSGERNPRAKLTLQQVTEIRTRYVRGETTAAMLAVEFGVTTSTAAQAISGKRWPNCPAKPHPTRSVYGDSNPNAKLTQGQVAEIRSLVGRESLRMLGRRFGVSKTTIWGVQHGRIRVEHSELPEVR